MGSPRNIHNKKEPQSLSPCNSGRRRSSFGSKSPEFEFWRVRNPSLPPPNILSADELFFGGVLLPLHLLPHKVPDPPDQKPKQPDPEPLSSNPPVPEPGPGPELSNESSTTVLSASKRWKDFFKKSSDKKTPPKSQEDKEKENKREKKSQNGATSSAELNIYIWPFSRSRSAGNSVTRPRMVFGGPGIRKVSSAPCSRSNSAGESKSRKWPASPGRAGIHLGRSSPVWQVRRGGGSGPKSSEAVVRSGEKVFSKKAVTETRKSKTAGENDGDAKSKVINLNVPMCIGYRSRFSCRSDETRAIDMNSSSSDNSNIGSGNSNVGSGGNNLFGLRNFFAKKVY